MKRPTRSWLYAPLSFLIVLQACCVGAAAAQSFSCEEPRTGERRSRIAGGSIANPNDFPWQVSVRGTFTGMCGGSLIGARWVLTAAHCVDRHLLPDGQLKPGVSLDVFRASTEGGSDGKRRTVVRGFVHPQYDIQAAGQPKDFAILELGAPYAVEPRDLSVLATPEIDRLYVRPGVCATVTGWGARVENGFASSKLQKANVAIQSPADCSAAYPSEDISDDHICAGYKAGGFDSCQGDSGGPLVVRGGPEGWLQVGVVSWGYGCAEPGRFGVYQRVGALHSWIAETISRVSD